MAEVWVFWLFDNLSLEIRNRITRNEAIKLSKNR